MKTIRVPSRDQGDFVTLLVVCVIAVSGCRLERPTTPPSGGNTMRVEPRGSAATSEGGSIDPRDQKPAADSDDPEGRRALLSAVASGDRELLAVLVSRGVDVEFTDDEGRSPLACAVANNDLAAAALLLDAGATIGSLPMRAVPTVPLTSDLHGSLAVRNRIPLLSLAVLMGTPSMARLLVEHGASIDGQDEYGSSALGVAVTECDLSMAMLLIELGADLNIRDSRDWSPLHKAVRCRCMSVLRVLVRSGADVNQPDESGMTPLHVAVSTGNLEVCRFLVANDADLTLRDNRGRTAASLASSLGLTGAWMRILREGDEDDRSG